LDLRVNRGPPNSSPKLKVEIPNEVTDVRIIFQLLLCLLVSAVAWEQASAISVHGEVAEVFDGNTISVKVDQRLIKVHLCGIANSNANDAFEPIAREHLVKLSYGKSVDVEFIGLLRQSSVVVGVASLEGIDLGMQMLRDGAGVFDEREGSQLPLQLRALYQESERVARQEARGIWQAVTASANEGNKPVTRVEDNLTLSAEGEAKRINDEAYSLTKQSNYKAALPKVREALRLDPNLAEAHKNLALIFCDTGRPEDGILEAREAIRLKPDVDKSHFVMGHILFALGDYESSVNEYSEAIRLNPKYSKAHYNLGVVLTEMGLYDRALKAYNEAGKLDPQLADNELNTGWVLYKMGRSVEAKRRWEKVLKMNDPIAALKAENNLRTLIYKR
jgi:Tfp pilus assembly protein PilF